MEFKFSFFTKLCLLFLIIENLDVATGFAPIIPVIISAVSLGVSIISMSLSADTTADKKKNSPIDKENHEALMNKLDEIRSLIGRIDANSQAIQGIGSAIQSEGQHILEQLSLKADKDKIQEFFNVITHVHRKFDREFLKYAGNLDKYHNSTINHYLQEMIDDDDFKYKLEFVVDSIVKSDEERLLGIDKVFDVIKGYLIKNADKYLCGPKSLYDQMFGIYNLAVATLVKGYTMIGYAYNIRRERLSDPNAFKQEMLDVVKNFKEAAIKITQNARHYIYAMDKIEYEQHELCDPEEWKEGENFFILKNCLTTHIYPFAYSELFRPRVFEMIEYPQIMCPNGRLENTCTRHEFTHLCLAPPESGRRFWSVGEKIISQLSNHKFNEKFTTLGIKTHKECVDLNVFNNLTGVFEACTCVDPRKNLPGTLRAFSLRVHSTNVSRQSVVTGIRFYVELNSVTINLQSGTLVNGVVDPKSVKWDEFYGDMPADKIDSINLSKNLRSLNLDEIILPKGEFVTGAKFVVENNRLALRVAGTKMYDDAGFLISNPETNWRSSSDSDHRLNPLESHSSTVYHDKTTDYVEFNVTSWEKDLGQTTLPFFDSREVTSNPPSPLGGIGIYYKNYEPGMKEFLSLKTISAVHNRLLTDQQLNVFRITEYSNNFISSNY